jgi:parallel beta-helix repeat protein
MLTLALNIRPVKASGTIYIRVDGRIDPPTANITTADNITYTFTDNNYDGIVVERGNIVIDGNGYTLQGTGSGSGFYWSGTNNVAIKNTKIRGFNLGIYLEYSKNNSIVGNNITANNEYGILLSHASNSTLSGNVMGGNRYNFGVTGSALSDFLQSVDTSNLVDGKPVYYFVNQSDIVASAVAYPEVGYLGFVNCVNVTVQGLNLTGNGQGLLLAFTNDSKITGNNVANNGNGIHLYDSFNNSISENHITANNWAGLGLYYSSNSTVYGNNITANDWVGIDLGSSSNNTVYGNHVTANNWAGIYLEFSSNNAVHGNYITANKEGFNLFDSFSNTVYGNNITANNWFGIDLIDSFSNEFYHNNFINNGVQVYSVDSANVWDDGYPSGGNYWSDYDGVDLFSGPYQNMTGSDGMGDTPHVLDVGHVDHYPLMKHAHISEPDAAVTNVTSAKTIIGQGYGGNVTVTAQYLGDFTENFNVTTYANLTVIGTLNFDLTSGSTESKLFVWNTTGFTYGNYTLKAAADVIPGETDIADNNYTCPVPVHVGVPGDISGPTQGVYDGTCNMRDIQYLILYFNTNPSSPNWKPNADINNDGTVNMRDITIAILNFNKHE